MEPVIVQARERPASALEGPKPRFQLREPITIVIFGVTGDLAARKLLPALYSLRVDRHLPEAFAIVGVGRRDKSDAQFREELKDTIQANCRTKQATQEDWDLFATRLFYQPADVNRADDLQRLKAAIEELEKRENLAGNRLYYLATDPELFPVIVTQCAAAGLIKRHQKTPWMRVIIEKPFGSDLASAVVLNRTVLQALDESQVFRIDHYLGKETVQNILAFRLGNSIFEPIFNRRYVDQVQITMAETLGMEGHRGSFYDHTGALRDVVQNHLLQLLALITMEPPSVLKAKEIRDEKVKMLRSLIPLGPESVRQFVVRGQYGPGMIDDKPVRGYRDEEGVSRDSNTESYVALRLEMDNWRWAGVPFLIRAGKRLPRRVTEVAVYFKLPPLRLFRTVECEAELCTLAESHPNVLAFRIQPNEGIDLTFSAKRPGFSMELQPVRMDFRYQDSFGPCPPEAYERLLLDAMQGDATLFMRSDEVESAWEFITPILEAWQGEGTPQFPNYAAGTWGPAEGARLTEGCQQGWRQL